VGSIQTPIHLFGRRCVANASHGLVGDPSADTFRQELITLSRAYGFRALLDLGRIRHVLRLEFDRRALVQDLVAVGFRRRTATPRQSNDHNRRSERGAPRAQRA